MPNTAAKSAVVRARCSPQIKRAVTQIATREQLDESDIVRRALDLYVRHARARRSMLPY